MPVRPCQRGGVQGFRWGERGYCYVGKGAKARAAQQGRAIEAAQARRRDAVLSSAHKAMEVPSKIEARYRRALLNRVRELHAFVGRALRQVLEARTADRRDALSDDLALLRRVVRATRSTWENAHPVDVGLIESVGEQVDRHATRSTQTMVERLVNVPVSIPGGSAALLHQWVRQNVDLIKSIDDRYFQDITTIISEGFESGRRTRDIRAQLEQRLGVTRRRAQLIARDQLATINARVTQARQEALGINQYQWVTSGDDRVRPEHAAVDGDTFNWTGDNAGLNGEHPGEPVNCRCVPVPVVDADNFSSAA